MAWLPRSDHRDGAIEVPNLSHSIRLISASISNTLASEGILAGVAACAVLLCLQDQRDNWNIETS